MYAHTLSRTVVVVIPAQMCPQYTDVSAFIRPVVSTTVSMLKFSPIHMSGALGIERISTEENIRTVVLERISRSCPRELQDYQVFVE